MAISCLVVNIIVSEAAMKGFVGAAKSQLSPVVIVAKLRSRFRVLNVEISEKVRYHP